MSQELILAVTDQRQSRHLLTLANAPDTTLRVVESPEQAVAAAHERRVPVVILDSALIPPEKMGAWAHQALAASSVIGLLTREEAATSDLEAMGLDEILVKPSPLDLIRLTLDRALERQRLKRQAERMALVNRVGRQITSILDMDKLLWEVARLIQRSFDLYHVAIALVDAGAVEMRAAVGGEPNYVPSVGARYEWEDQEQLMAVALSRGRPLLFDDLRQAQPQRVPPELAQARAALVMPIGHQGRWLGALELLSDRPGAFDAADLTLFESLAAQIAVAVQNARLFAERQKHQEALRSLNVAALSMQRAITSRRRVLEVMVDELSRSGFVSLVHILHPGGASAGWAGDSLSPRIAKALTELLGVPPANWRLDLTEASIYRQALDARGALFVEQVEPLIRQIVPGSPPSKALDMAVRILGHPCAVVSPMLSGDKTLGCLTVFSAQLSAPDVLPMSIFANQAAVALENARLLAEARRADALARLNEAARAMASTLELEEVLRLLLRAAASMLGVETCGVALWDEAAQRHVPRAELANGDVSLAPPVEGLETWARAFPSGPIPLVAHGRELGLLVLGRRADGDEPGAEAGHLAQALVNQAASALENARLYTELKQSAEELERSQRRLIQSGKLAATGRLTASIAHEINNPLQAIKNCLELIVDEAEAGEPLDRTYLDVAMAELERIRSIIQQLLDLYRPRRERMRPVGLNVAVNGVLALMGKQLEKQGVRVETELDEADPHVIGRGDQIRQVLINLLLNAIEAMPDGGRVTLSTRQDGEDTVVIRVADTGLGIAPENLTRIADPFFTTKPKGLGLGLTICHEIVERHRGTWDVTSQVGRGSTFTVRLPAAGPLPATVKRERSKID
jgi:signal transduction histidine kinase